jgi:hypothetical protein
VLHWHLYSVFSDTSPDPVKHCAMTSKTLSGTCAACEDNIDYDGTTDNYVMCDGYCRQTFHIDCLSFSVPSTVWKLYRTRKEFLFFCDDCRELQKNFVMRRNFAEAERSVAKLLGILQAATAEVDAMCCGVVGSASAAISSKKSNASETSVVDFVSPKARKSSRRNKKKRTTNTTNLAVTTPVVTVTVDESAPQTSTPQVTPRDDDFLTPLPPSPKKRSTNKGFFGTSGAASQISAAAERKVFVISRVHPATTPDGITDFIKQNTGVEDVRCQLMLPKGRDVMDLDYVSFKISATVAGYEELMRPEIWPAKVLVRDFFQSNRRRSGGPSGFHKF